MSKKRKRKSELLVLLLSSKVVVNEYGCERLCLFWGEWFGRFCCCFYIVVSFLEEMDFKDCLNLGRENDKRRG